MTPKDACLSAAHHIADLQEYLALFMKSRKAVSRCKDAIDSCIPETTVFVAWNGLDFSLLTFQLLLASRPLKWVAGTH
jgi:hypothetical protein